MRFYIIILVGIISIITKQHHFIYPSILFVLLDNIISSVSSFSSLIPGHSFSGLNPGNSYPVCSRELLFRYHSGHFFFVLISGYSFSCIIPGTPFPVFPGRLFSLSFRGTPFPVSFSDTPFTVSIPGTAFPVSFWSHPHSRVVLFLSHFSCLIPRHSFFSLIPQ